MFVYKRIPSRGKPLASKERFFEGNERKPKLAPNKVLVVASSLLFGGICKLAVLPLAAFAVTVLVLAWLFAEQPLAGEPIWVNRLALGLTGLFYLGLGYCIGAPAMLGVGVLLWNSERL